MPRTYTCLYAYVHLCEMYIRNYIIAIINSKQLLHLIMSKQLLHILLFYYIIYFTNITLLES